MPKKAAQKITAWSFSRLKDYEECPFKAKLKVIDRMREPDRPAMARGTAIHKIAEDFVKGTLAKMPSDMTELVGYPKFKTKFAALRKAAEKQLAVAEGAFTFTSAWTPTGWFEPDAWLRIKADAQLFVPAKKSVTIIDYKTGKIYEDSKQQLALYALAAFLFYPEDEVQTVTGELWYLDHGDTIPLAFERSEMDEMRRQWEARSRAMLNDTIFAPKPGQYCRWCHFRKSNGGPCKF